MAIEAAGITSSEAPVGRISNDGPWEWNGKNWRQAAKIAVPCARCGEEATVGSDKHTFMCANDHAQIISQCVACSRLFQIPAEHWDCTNRCPQCGDNSCTPLYLLGRGWLRT